MSNMIIENWTLLLKIFSNFDFKVPFLTIPVINEREHSSFLSLSLPLSLSLSSRYNLYGFHWITIHSEFVFFVTYFNCFLTVANLANLLWNLDWPLAQICVFDKRFINMSIMWNCFLIRRISLFCFDEMWCLFLSFWVALKFGFRLWLCLKGFGW